MNPISPATLRNASRKEGGGFRKYEPDFESFVTKWRSGLKSDVKEWEGSPAVAELKRRRMFDFLLAEGKLSRATQHLFRRMVYVTFVYRRATQIRLAKEYFDDVDEFLRRETKRVQKMEDRVPLKVLKNVLKGLRTNIYRTQGAVRWTKFTTEQLRFGFWEELVWAELPRRGLATRRLDLDTALQIELGKALGFYLRPKGVRVRTIARLVLLAYWAAELSTRDIDGDVSTTYTGRILELRNIYDNLRLKVQRAKGFRVRRRRNLTHELREARRSLGIPSGSRIGAGSLIYISKAAAQFGMTKRQIRNWIRPGQLTPPK